MIALVILGVLGSWVPVLAWPAFRRRRVLREARDAGVPVRWTGLLGMRLRRVDPGEVFGPMTRAARAGVPLAVDDVEGHLLAGGNPCAVVDALVLARQRGVDVTFQELCVVDHLRDDPVAVVRRHGVPGAGFQAMMRAREAAARNPA